MSLHPPPPLTPIDAIATHERALVVRIALTAAVIASCLLGLGAYLMITVRRGAALQERLMHAQQLLRAEKLATVGVLAAGIAHEIGTPLGIVRGRAEYIRGKLGEHTQTAGLGVIIEQIDLISRTIRQLLDFSRVRPPTVRAVRLAQLARAVAELLRFEGERRKVTLQVEVDESRRAGRSSPSRRGR